MKKILIALLATVMSFNAFAVTYDFSSAEKLTASVNAQAKAEGVSEEDAATLVNACMLFIAVAKASEIEALGEDEEKIGALILSALEAEIQGKSLEEIATILDEAIPEE